MQKMAFSLHCLQQKLRRVGYILRYKLGFVPDKDDADNDDVDNNGNSKDSIVSNSNSIEKDNNNNEMDIKNEKDNNEDSDSPLYSFTDEENLHTKASKPIICVHAGLGSAKSYFDDVRMSIVNKDGVIWIENNTDKDTKVFGTQYSVLNVEYGGVE